MEKSRADPLFDAYFWKKIGKALLANALTVPLVITALFAFGIVDEPFSKAIETFQKGYPAFFWPLNKFFDFAGDYVLKASLAEEFFTRGPVRILVAIIVLFRKEAHWLAYTVYWSAGLFLNYQWAGNHTVHEFGWLPVFVAGLPWLWLVIRTNRLWPAMFCHTAANLSIYFVVKVYQFLY